MVVEEKVDGGSECSQVLRARTRGFWNEEGLFECGLVDGGDASHAARLISAAWCSRPICFKTEVLTPRSSVLVRFEQTVVGTRYLPAQASGVPPNTNCE